MLWECLVTRSLLVFVSTAAYRSLSSEHTIIIYIFLIFNFFFFFFFLAPKKKIILIFFFTRSHVSIICNDFAYSHSVHSSTWHTKWQD